jgi:hypothetical protein
VKTLTVRLPAKLAAEIESEARLRHVSKSDVVRERLETPYTARKAGKEVPTMDLIADLIGPVKGLPADVSSRKKFYLKKWGYGKDGSDRRRLSRRAA